MTAKDPEPQDPVDELLAKALEDNQEQENTRDFVISWAAAAGWFWNTLTKDGVPESFATDMTVTWILERMNQQRVEEL